MAINQYTDLDNGLDGPLLDGGGFLEAVGVDPPQQVLPQAHGVEGWDNLVKTFHIKRGGKIFNILFCVSNIIIKRITPS